jgi:hypothetical protein
LVTSEYLAGLKNRCPLQYLKKRQRRQDALRLFVSTSRSNFLANPDNTEAAGCLGTEIEDLANQLHLCLNAHLHSSADMNIYEILDAYGYSNGDIACLIVSLSLKSWPTFSR